MKNKTGKMLLAIIMISVMISSSISISAAIPENETVMPLWDNILTITNSINFDGTNGAAIGCITGKTGTTRIEGTIVVYRQTDSGGWSYVGSNADLSYSNMLAFSAKFDAVSGEYYKSVLSTIVYINGVSESEKITSYRYCP